VRKYPRNTFARGVPKRFLPTSLGVMRWGEAGRHEERVRLRECLGAARRRDLESCAANDARRLPDGEDGLSAAAADVLAFADALPYALAVKEALDCKGRRVSHWRCSNTRAKSRLGSRAAAREDPRGDEPSRARAPAGVWGHAKGQDLRRIQ
jgi:hypothetical protein